MTVSEFEELARYSAKHPPVHLLVAAFVGYKGEEATEPRVSSERGESLPLQYQIGGIPGIEFGSLPDGLSPTFDPEWLN